MGVAPTGDIFRGFVFDNENSKDFGVYITGEAVYNAPERDMEMISIPGRNGSFALDNGRWENIEVTYSAGIAGDSQTDFAEAISDLRNMLVSKTTYCRLTDDYNPGEYRMALYKSGLDVTPELARGGGFDIVFECKPQRFLVDGDTPITVASGDVLTNPTRFDASPLLAVTGYGDISIGDSSITVDDSPVGWMRDVPISVLSDWSRILAEGSHKNLLCRMLAPDAFNNGDTLQFTWSHFRVLIPILASSMAHDLTVTSTVCAECSVTGYKMPTNSEQGWITIAPDMFEGSMGNSTGVGGYANINIEGIRSGAAWSGTYTVTFEVGFDASTNRFYFTWSTSIPSGLPPGTGARASETMHVDGYSTKHSLGQPLYIDTDIGEAYVVSDGVTVSANSIVKMGSTLPRLAPGDNEITQNVTTLQVTPRWWKL